MSEQPAEPAPAPAQGVIKVRVTGHIAFDFDIDPASQQFDYLHDVPRDEWAEVLQDDEEISGMWQRAMDGGIGVADGWLDVTELAAELVNVVSDL